MRKSYRSTLGGLASLGDVGSDYSNPDSAGGQYTNPDTPQPQPVMEAGYEGMPCNLLNGGGAHAHYDDVSGGFICVPDDAPTPVASACPSGFQPSNVPGYPCVSELFGSSCGIHKSYDAAGNCITDAQMVKDYGQPGAPKPVSGGGGVVKPKPVTPTPAPVAKAGMGTIVFGLLVAAGAAVIGKKMWDKKHGH